MPDAATAMSNSGANFITAFVRRRPIGLASLGLRRTALRMDPDVPLVVSEVNPHALRSLAQPTRGLRVAARATTRCGRACLSDSGQASDPLFLKVKLPTEERSTANTFPLRRATAISRWPAKGEEGSGVAACSTTASASRILPLTRSLGFTSTVPSALLRSFPTGPGAVEGLERADSLAFDLHKRLSQPYDVGCILVAAGRALEGAFFHTAYTSRVSDSLTDSPTHRFC